MTKPVGITDKKPVKENENEEETFGETEQTTFTESEDGGTEETPDNEETPDSEETSDSETEETPDSEDAASEEAEDTTSAPVFSASEVADYAEVAGVPISAFTGQYTTLTELKEVVLVEQKKSAQNASSAPASKPKAKKDNKPDVVGFNERMSKIVSG